MVCLRFNAKDSTGKYEGSRDRLVAFLSGRLDTLVPARKEQCAQDELAAVSGAGKAAAVDGHFWRTGPARRRVIHSPRYGVMVL